jgi:hypothetical protein
MLVDASGAAATPGAALGERLPRLVSVHEMNDDALVDAAAAAAATGIRSLDLASWAELLLIPCDSLCPLIFGLSPDAVLESALESDTRVELGFLPDPENEAFEEVATRADGIGDDAYTLFVSYYRALATRLRAETGLPVLIDGFGPDEEQLALQAGAPVRGPDGLDVLVSLQVRADRLAVVYRGHDGQVWGTDWHGVVEPQPGVERYASLGSSPAIFAGALPFGAAAVKLRIGRAPWVEPTAVNRGFWLCVLDAVELTHTPQLVYSDAEGVEFTIEVPLDEADLPAVWPTQAPATGRLVAYSPAHSNQLEADGWQVEILSSGPILPLGQGLLDTPAFLVARRLRVPEASVSSRPIVGSVLGHRHGFELAAQDGRWAAVANCGTFAVTVQGTGTPAKRLDLELVPLP